MSTQARTAVGRFVWHDHSSADVEQARDFYRDLLGWEYEVWKPGEADYPMIKVGGKTHGGFGPAGGGAPPRWLGHVLVEDVDESARTAEAAGGTIVKEPTDIPEIGRFAVIADPQGAVLSLFAGQGDASVPEGTFVWDELLTTDVDAAKSFYAEVFGWTAEDAEMGGGTGTYTLFKRPDGADVGGCMRRPDGVEAPPGWFTYIATDDVDATAARAKELGGTVSQEATDIPGIGRFAVIQDPVGAVFDAFRPTTG
jgi:uncharacterized protein